MENKTVNTDFSIRENKALSPLQNFRYELLQWCGTTEDAVKAYQFVVGSNTIGCKKSKPQLEPRQIRDGIYLIDQSGFVIPYDPDNEPGRSSIEPYTIIGVGVKWGEHAIVVALKDEMDGAEITLTTKDTEEDSPAYYIKNVRDAVADWNHEANTEHLRKVLNPQIKLKDGWYIPAMGEMLFIFLNLKAINAALRYVGGQEIQEDWYWTSTELSSTNAWYLNLGAGIMNYSARASITLHVRAVSAFNF